MLTEQYFSYIHYKEKLKKKRVQQVEKSMALRWVYSPNFPTNKKKDKMGMIKNVAMKQSMNYS